jgi:hypothetical protein
VKSRLSRALGRLRALAKGEVLPDA